MDDLISRQTVLDAIEDEWHGCTGEYPASTIINDTCQRIENLPSAEPQERTGKWITHKRTDLGEKLNHCVECSECGVWFSVCELLRRSYCPNCGARMGVEHETD